MAPAYRDAAGVYLSDIYVWRMIDDGISEDVKMLILSQCIKHRLGKCTFQKRSISTVILVYVDIYNIFQKVIEV